jgi:hypothetical protein
MRTLGLGLVLVAAGCFGGGGDGDGWGSRPPPWLFDQAAPTPSDGGAPAPDDGGGALLGSGRAQPAAGAALHVRANASIYFPDAQTGFTVTANGNGGYRVAWVDNAGANRRYHGSVFVAGTFAQISSMGMEYAIANGGRLDFQSAPGAGAVGYVDFVSSVDPIVVDVLDGSRDGQLWYVGSDGVTYTVPTAATFTSP